MEDWKIMQDNKKYELNDKDLDEVAGGMASGDIPPREEVYVGDSLVGFEESSKFSARVVFDINTAP